VRAPKNLGNSGDRPEADAGRKGAADDCILKKQKTGPSISWKYIVGRYDCPMDEISISKKPFHWEGTREAAREGHCKVTRAADEGKKRRLERGKKKRLIGGKKHRK